MFLIWFWCKIFLDSIFLPLFGVTYLVWHYLFHLVLWNIHFYSWEASTFGRGTLKSNATIRAWKAESNLLPPNSSIYFVWESLLLPLEEVIMECGTLNIFLVIREDVKISTWHWKEGITQETDPINKETWLFQSASQPNKVLSLSFSIKALIFFQGFFLAPFLIKNIYTTCQL